jgi:hypothetical protein
LDGKRYGFRSLDAPQCKDPRSHQPIWSCFCCSLQFHDTQHRMNPWATTFTSGKPTPGHPRTEPSMLFDFVTMLTVALRPWHIGTVDTYINPRFPGLNGMYLPGLLRHPTSPCSSAWSQRYKQNQKPKTKTKTKARQDERCPSLSSCHRRRRRSAALPLRRGPAWCIQRSPPIKTLTLTPPPRPKLRRRQRPGIPPSSPAPTGERGGGGRCDE